MASVRVSDGEVRQRFLDQNQKINAEYALFDASAIGDNDVQVSDADLKAYYDENIDQFKFDATRSLKYVYFQDKPSPSDSSMREKDITEAASRAKSGADFLQLVSTYSDQPDSGSFFRHGELSPAVEAIVFTAKPGDVVGPVLTHGTYRLMKVLDQRQGSNAIHSREPHPAPRRGSGRYHGREASGRADRQGGQAGEGLRPTCTAVLEESRHELKRGRSRLVYPREDGRRV